MTLYENNVLPAVSVIATPEDMGRFIIAHNKEARKQANKPIYDTQFSYDIHIPGYAYAFHEKLHGGHRFLEHSGDAAAFGKETDFYPVASHLFKNDQDQYITFSENDSGKINKIVYLGGAFERIPWYHVSLTNDGAGLDRNPVDLCCCDL
ncbi:hypothetical protein ABEX25_21075 [Paenibacillus thiaminolyticus]|uniref:hypothetical protein n=1 Tax=Paenibacillus thiaminolyticus TaxID=49283 RepID=UPI003D28B7A4